MLSDLRMLDQDGKKKKKKKMEFMPDLYYVIEAL